MENYPLDRFIKAQEGVYSRVINELKSARKQSHWMWFVFPQVAGLGHSLMSRKYALANLKEARDYLHHALLSDRLKECTDLVLRHKHHGISDIFGFPDDLKFHASMTLFDQAGDNDASEFREAIDAFFDGKFHQQTIDILGSQSLGGLTD